MKTKVEFSIVYNLSLTKEIGELMSRMDLGVEGLEAPQKETISWNTTTKVTKKYLKMMESKLKEAYEKEGNTVLEITHIK